MAGTLGHIHRLQVVWTKGGADDVDVTTHDFRQVDSSWPDAGDAGMTHNAAQMEADFDTFMNAIKTRFASSVGISSYRWYRNDSPVLPWGEPWRVTVKGAPLMGTGAGGGLPPQVACTVSELTDSRRHWGRFYLPQLVASLMDANGRPDNTSVSTIATAAKALYDSWNSRGLHCCVLGSVKTSYNLALLPGTSWVGNEISKWIGKGISEQRVMIAYDVRKIRVDNTLDIIRRRRWNVATFKDERTLA